MADGKTQYCASCEALQRKLEKVVEALQWIIEDDDTKAQTQNVCCAALREIEQTAPTSEQVETVSDPKQCGYCNTPLEPDNIDGELYYCPRCDAMEEPCPAPIDNVPGIGRSPGKGKTASGTSGGSLPANVETGNVETDGQSRHGSAVGSIEANERAGDKLSARDATYPDIDTTHHGSGGEPDWARLEMRLAAIENDSQADFVAELMDRVTDIERRLDGHVHPVYQASTGYGEPSDE